MNEEGRDEVVFERLLADRETPFTDFRVEDSEGQPRAVFDRLTPEQSSLLAHFLYPDKAYISALYLDSMKVESREAPPMSFEDDVLKAIIDHRNVVLETKEQAKPASSPLRMKLPLSDAKYLLLKWKFECIRWEAIQQNTGNTMAGIEPVNKSADI
jgi:hypothetical protein